jgi:hypothetical protein
MAFEFYNTTSKVWIERPELGTYAASVSQIWALIEQSLSHIFIILSGSNLALGAAFVTVIPIRNRLNMIQKLVDRFLDDADRKRYQDLAARVERIGRRRNDVVHGLWSIKKDHPDVVFLHIRYPRTQEEAEPVAYGGKDKFKRLILDLEALRADVGKFRSHLSDLAKAEPFPRSFLIVNE